MGKKLGKRTKKTYQVGEFARIQSELSFRRLSYRAW